MGIAIKKPIKIEYISFEDFVQYGREHAEGELHNNMPWSFDYKGQPITHKNDKCYLVPTNSGIAKFTPDDVLLTQIDGEIYPCKKDIFEATYIKEYKMEHLNNALIAFKGSTPIVFDPLKKENIDLSTLISLRDNYLHIAIQDGTIPSVGVNGIQVTDLLKYVKEVYISLNNAYPSIYNEGTIIAINQALASQESRTKDREKRGVEGQNKL